jgi:hypothetical protein
MAMYSFVPPYRKAKFCGVFDKLGCAAGEKGCGTLSYTQASCTHIITCGMTYYY